MQIKYYEDYIHFINIGRRKEATNALKSFIASFTSTVDKSNWVWTYLEQLPKLIDNKTSGIRHEIFKELIFPVLKTGYLNHDFASILWLAKLIHNLYGNENLHQEIDYISYHELLNIALKIEPKNIEVKNLLLDSIVSQLEYYIHEWPVGILYDHNGADLTQCNLIRKKIILAKNLDTDKTHHLFLADFEEKLSEYETRLIKFLKQNSH